MKASRMWVLVASDFIRLSCPLFGPRKSPPRVSGFFRTRIPTGTNRGCRWRRRWGWVTLWPCLCVFCPFGAQSIFIAQLAYARGKLGECQSAGEPEFEALFFGFYFCDNPFFSLFWFSLFSPKSHAKELWRTINQRQWRRRLKLCHFGP